MAYDAAVALKSLGNMKSSQTSKGRKAGSAEDDAFGQALASAGAAGAADYRDQGAETQVKPESREPGNRTEAVSDAEAQSPAQPGGTAAVESTGDAGVQTVMAEKLAEVQAAQLMQAGQIVRAGEQKEEQPQMLQTAGEGISLEGVQMEMESGVLVRTEGQQIPEEALEQAAELMQAEAEELPGEFKKAAAMPENEPEKAPEQIMQTAEETAAVEASGTLQKEAGGTSSGTPEQGEAEEQRTEAVDVKAEALADKAGTQAVYEREAVMEEPVQAESHVTPSGEMREEYADMLKDLIAKQITSGKQEIELSLTPKSLGNLIVKVAYAAGETTVSIVCTNQKAMQAMSQKAGELGQILEDRLGTRMEVVVETDSRQESYLYQDGRNGAGGGEEQEQDGSGQKKQQDGKEPNPEDFLQQLRLGLA